MQVFYLASGRREPMLGVVGALQYDVIASRLKNEYGVAAEIEPQAYAAARWLGDVDGPSPPLGGACVMTADSHGRRVILFTSEWELRYFERHHPDVKLFEESPALG
jgi:peptide chain release factor 3